MRENLYHGWHQVAFERELQEKLTATKIGNLSLILVRDAQGVRAFDAACPHRGAHLAYGGKLEQDEIVCPFHGRRIGLGHDSTCQFKIRGYRTLDIGGLIFVLLDERHENGFSALLERLNKTHFFVQGFKLLASAPAEMVIENGFDHLHFEAVHGLNERPDLRLRPSLNGEMIVEGTLLATAFDNHWHSDAEGAAHTQILFQANVFSPNVCVTRLGDGDGEYLVVSGATPNGDGQCTIRVAVAVPARADGLPPSEQAIRSLLRDSKVSYEQDIVIWKHRFNDVPSRFDADDELVIAFHKFCKQFLEANAR
jgi:3-ketosteroid 9alpha-monooxygenase subunit A